MKAGAVELVRMAEVARFLKQDAMEVREMVEVDGLPHLKVPGKTKPSVRVALRDLHAFLLRKWQGETVLRDYAVFREEFIKAQASAE